jgi:hypothetical protein
VRDTRSSRDKQDLMELLRVGTSSIRSLNSQPQIRRPSRRLRQTVRKSLGHSVTSAHDEEHLVASLLVRFVAVGDVGDREGVGLEVDLRGAEEG